MKKTIDGKRYDTDNCEVLGEDSRYNNGNYAGSVNLIRAKNGTLLLWGNSNGQDLYFNDFLSNFPGHSGYNIDDFEMNDEQEKRCADLGLIEIV